jgi:hypothetical protein
MSETDVRLFFGENYPKAGGEIVAIEKFNVVLSPQHAKLILSSLAQLIAGYEKLFGSIKPLTPIAPGAGENALAQAKADEQSK